MQSGSFLTGQFQRTARIYGKAVTSLWFAGKARRQDPFLELCVERKGLGPALGALFAWSSQMALQALQ
jgi:hypothetical protein